MAIYESENGQPAVNVYPNAGGFGGYGGDGFGNNGAWWIIILFLFAMMGGWNNNGNNGNNGSNVAYVPYGMSMGFGGAAPNFIQQGFDQAAIMGGINGIQTALSGAEVSRCNAQANILAAMNNNQNALTAGMNSLAMGLQNCCCENRAATADLKYTVATEACADRAAVTDALQSVTAQGIANTTALMNTINAGIQSIKDQLCQDKIDSKNEKITELQNQLTLANLAASQNAQTAAILANNDAQTAALEQYLAPVPRPAYVVQNPNCCGSNYYSACNCANAG